MRYLIINADDFGLTEGVNKGIIAAHKCGTLTSATLMAGGLAWREAVALAQAYPNLGVGVHLTLSALRPVLPPEQIPSLVDKHGQFRKQFWRAPLWKKEQVRREWRAQIQRLVDAGLQPTHLDSHHHTHIWPPLIEVAAQLAEEFGIPAFRVISPESFTIMGIGGWQQIVARRSWHRAAGFPQGRPATVAGIDAFEGTAAGIDRYLAKLRPGVHELYCHPGGPGDSELVNLSSLREKRVKETEMLCSPWFKKALVRHDIQLVSYKFIGEEGV